MKMRIKLRHKQQDIKWYIAMVLFYLLITTGGAVKYDIVLLFAIILLARTYKNPIKIGILLLSLPVILYVVLGSLCAVFHQLTTIYYIKQIVFFSVPILFAVTLYSYFHMLCPDQIQRMLDIQFWSIITVFIYRQAKIFNLTNLMESQYAFIFGIYTLYYLHRKKYPLLLCSILFMFLGHKRIVIAACLLCSLFILLNHLTSSAKKLMLTVFAFFEILILYSYIYFCNAEKFLGIRISLDRLFSGRLRAWNQLTELYTFGIGYIGKGAGWVLSTLEQLKIPFYDNLHNDILSLYIELGFWGFGVWIILTFCVLIHTKASSKVLVFTLLTYTLINLCTDNISIYIAYLIPYYNILLSIIGLERKELSDVSESRNTQCG